MAQHIAETYGEPALQKLVRSYSRGITDEQAFKEALNQTVEQLQASFDAAIDKTYATVRKALKRPTFEGTPELDDLKKMAESNAGSFAVQVALGQALEKAGDHGAAIAAFERAATLMPRATGDDNPNVMIAAIAEKQGDTGARHPGAAGRPQDRSRRRRGRAQARDPGRAVERRGQSRGCLPPASSTSTRSMREHRAGWAGC